MLFNKFNQVEKSIEGVKFHFIKANTKQILCSVVTKSGSNYEQLKNLQSQAHFLNGTAHFVEHLLFHDYKNNLYFTNTYRKNAINHNAMTSTHLINYFIKTSSEVFEQTGFENIIKNVFSFSTSESWFAKEKNVVLSELLNHEHRDHFLEVSKKFTNSRNIIGTKESVEQITYNQCLDFYQKNFKCDNTDIFIVGDITPNFIDKIAGKFIDIKNDIINTYEVHMFDNKNDFKLLQTQEVILDKNDYQVLDLKQNPELFTTIVAVNRCKYQLSVQEFKKMLRLYRYLNHFSVTREQEFTKLALANNVIFEHTGIKLLYFNNTDETFYIQLIIANIDNMYSSKRINKKLAFLRTLEHQIFMNINEDDLNKFVNDITTNKANDELTNHFNEITQEFTFDKLVDNYVIFDFDDVDIKKELTIENINKYKIQDFENYLNLTIKNKE